MLLQRRAQARDARLESLGLKITLENMNVATGSLTRICGMARTILTEGPNRFDIPLLRSATTASGSRSLPFVVLAPNTRYRMNQYYLKEIQLSNDQLSLSSVLSNSDMCRLDMLTGTIMNIWLGM